MKRLLLLISISLTSIFCLAEGETTPEECNGLLLQPLATGENSTRSWPSGLPKVQHQPDREWSPVAPEPAPTEQESQQQQ